MYECQMCGMTQRVNRYGDFVEGRGEVRTLHPLIKNERYCLPSYNGIVKFGLGNIDKWKTNRR